MIHKVYKLRSEHYEIDDEPTVYLTRESAVLAIKRWEDFLCMYTQDALDSGDVWVEEYSVGYLGDT